VTFAWPLVLLSLLAVPALLAAYLWALRRRRRRAVAYSSVALIRAARPRSPWRRHVPVGLLLAALTLLGVAAARPQARVDVPVSSSSIILALDVSGSMCATDVDPNRLSAAQDAVRDFVRGQKDNTRIGLVAFSGFAQVVVEPTTDRDELTHAIDSLTTGRGTAIGAAILKSIDAISQINPDVPPAQAPGSNSTTPGDTATPSPAPAPSAPGARRGTPEIVVLLTDGANTRGVTPVDAARVAAERGVRVYPIGFGTTNPTMMVCTAQQLGGNTFENPGRGFAGGGLGGSGSPLVADESTLREVADVTGGTYFAASDAEQLQSALGDLPRHVRMQQRDVELTVWLSTLGALLALLAVGAAVRWSTFPA
jgi:Ca-activated chloride channel family protein